MSGERFVGDFLMKGLCLVLFAVLSLTGCAELYKAAYPYEYQKQQEQIAVDKSKAEKAKCEQQYSQSDAFAPIRPMIPYRAEEATFAQLANNSKATKKEKPAIEALDALSQKCFQGYMIYFKEFNSGWRVNLAEAYQQNQRVLLLRLWEGGLTYGQYAEQRLKLKQVRDQILEEELQKRRQGMADDLLMLQALGAFNSPKVAAPAVQPQRPFNAPGTVVNPIQTNCSSMGGTVNCQTFSQ